MRGVNEMLVFSDDKAGARLLPEIAKTGANTVRIVWLATAGVPPELDAALSRTAELGMLAILDLHDATGKLWELPAEVAFWSRPDVVELVAKHAGHVLVNIANEPGDEHVPLLVYEAALAGAVRAVRAAGIEVPLVVDAPSWGQDLSGLLTIAPRLLAADPKREIVLSVHPYWLDGSRAALHDKLWAIEAAPAPLIVGELAPHAVFECGAHPFDLAYFLPEAQARGIGWLAWSWGGVSNNDCDGSFDMTAGGSFDALRGWGREVVFRGEGGIARSSARSGYVSRGTCDVASRP